MTKRKPILCLDFDGVCNSYTSGWQGETNIPDDAVPGLFEFLERVAPLFDIQVFSSRSKTPEGRTAMQTWFEHQRRKWREDGGGQGFKEIIEISFPATKPPATITLDDRALTFNGKWPSNDTLLTFQPWHKLSQVDTYTGRCQEWVMFNDCRELIQCQLTQGHEGPHWAYRGTPANGAVIKWEITKDTPTTWLPYAESLADPAN